MPSALPSWQPSAKHESVGYAISPPERMMSTTCAIARGWGLSGWTSKYFAMGTSVRPGGGGGRC